MIHLWSLFGKRLRTTTMYCIPIIIGNQWHQYNRKPSFNEWPKLWPKRTQLMDKKKTIQELHDNAIEYLVRIRMIMRDFDGQEDLQFGNGTGWVIDKSGLIVTNCHVALDVTLLQVDLYDRDDLDDNNPVLYNTSKASVVYVEPEHDLAVVRLQSGRVLNLPTATLSAEAPAIGTEVTALGFPNTDCPMLATGIIRCNDREASDMSYGTWGYNEWFVRPEKRFMTNTIDVFGGASGGPLLDPSGAVCAVTFASLDQRITMAINADYVNGLIDRSKAFAKYYSNDKHLNYDLNSLGITVHDFNDDFRQLVDEEYWTYVYGDYAERNGVLVYTTLPIAPLDSDFFNGYDLIVRVDGKDVTDIRQLKREIRGKLQMNVLVVREGDLKDLTITRQPIDYYFM